MKKGLLMMIAAGAWLFASAGIAFQIFGPTMQSVYGPVTPSALSQVVLDGCSILKTDGKLYFIWDDTDPPDALSVNIPPQSQPGMSFSDSFFPVTKSNRTVEVQVWVQQCGPIRINISNGAAAR